MPTRKVTNMINLKKELNSGNTHRAEVILDSFKIKRPEKPQETISERVNLNP